MECIDGADRNYVDTYRSLETLEIGSQDWIRHTRFLMNTLHDFHLVRHLT